jgi:hypothetical protein
MKCLFFTWMNVACGHSIDSVIPKTPIILRYSPPTGTAFAAPSPHPINTTLQGHATHNITAGKWFMHNITDIFLSTTNKMQRYTVFFIVVSGLHVSRGFSENYQELKNCAFGYLSHLFAATSSMGKSEVLTHPCYRSQQTSLTSTRCCMHSFWAPDDEQKKRSKHVEHWQQ